MQSFSVKINKMEHNYPFISMLRKYVSSSVLLVIATISALVIANSPWGDFYRNIWELPVSMSVGDFNIFSHGGHAMSLGTFINEFLMAIFFLSVGLEIKREVLCGELSSMKKALAPIIGACGGMIVPIILFFLACPNNAVMERGMTIPMATDIAFSLGCLSIFNKRCPVGLKVFLAALAVADDLGGIIVIAIRYTEEINLWYLLAAILTTIVLCAGNYLGIRTKTFYFNTGILLWYFMLSCGIHSTIAGVVLAFCVPANIPKGTKFYIERIRNKLKYFPATVVTRADRNKPILLSDKEIAMLKSVESASDHLISPLQDIEDILKMPVNYHIIPLFAFANAGVNFAGMSLMNLFSGVGLAVFLGLFVGKFCGVLSFSWLGIRLGITQMPQNANWKSFAGVCMLCGIGFTVSMFMASLSYPTTNIDLLNNAKLGILCGTLTSAIVGCVMLKFFLPSEEEMNRLHLATEKQNEAE